MTDKFKIGDKVQLINNESNRAYSKTNFNGIMGKFTISSIEGDVAYFEEWRNCAFLSRLELLPTPIPLYSEEQAVSFLKEKGYTILTPPPPPEPKKGKLYCYTLGGGNVFGYPIKQIGAGEPIAIVDWTEGDGLPNKE